MHSTFAVFSPSKHKIYVSDNIPAFRNPPKYIQFFRIPLRKCYLWNLTNEIVVYCRKKDDLMIHVWQGIVKQIAGQHFLNLTQFSRKVKPSFRGTILTMQSSFRGSFFANLTSVRGISLHRPTNIGRWSGHSTYRSTFPGITLYYKSRRTLVRPIWWDK